ncbi:hypothetical protein HDV00_002907 [Rhizophlyctis rosea]|nr:hypothetical protein HDV00_002907 [Rhizophlyctis rosea]
MAEAGESHGIFQFGGADSDDDLFEAPKTQRHFIDWTYKTQPTVPGWYSTKLDEVPAKFTYKTGPDELQHYIEHLYLHGRFEESLTFAKAYLDANAARPKPLKAWELIETAARSALRLNRHKEALEIFGPLESKEPGHIFLKADILALNAQYRDSIIEYIRYLRIRNRDYSAWIRISAILESVFDTLAGANATQKQSVLSWAKLALEHALDIYNRTPRGDNSVANRNKAVVSKRISDGLAKFADCGGTADVDVLKTCLSMDDESALFLKTHLIDKGMEDQIEEEDSAVRGQDG